MFLAYKEIKHEKLRYSLIILMIFLISYLIFILSSLAVGLAQENTQAVESWKTQKVVLNKNSNVSMAQSILTKDDIKDAKIGKKEAYVGQVPIVVKSKNHHSVSAQFLGIKKSQFIYQNLKIIKGHKATKANEVTADIGFNAKGYKLGDIIKFGNTQKKYKIVGFAKNAKINIAPAIYGNLKTWKDLHQGTTNLATSGIISQDPHYEYNHKNAKTYNVKVFINKLPGYSAQNITFEMMIAFLFIISLIIIAVFLYILTIQKKQTFAVMRAQGIPAKTLVIAVISQSIILVITGIIIGLLAMWGTALIMPATVPMSFAPILFIASSLGMLLMGIIGSLIPIRTILKVDPAKAIEV